MHYPTNRSQENPAPLPVSCCYFFEDLSTFLLFPILAWNIIISIPSLHYSRPVFRIVYPYNSIRPTLLIPYVLSRTGSVYRITFLIRPVYRIEILIYIV